MESLSTRAEDGPYWGEAGHTYYAVQSGRMVALAYWSPPEPGELDGPGGEPVVVDPAWFIVMASDPDHHVTLVDAPPLRPGMPYEELVNATDAALAVAESEIESRLR